MSTDEQLQKALYTYLARTKNRIHPPGRRDRKQRWFPARKEKLPCCKLLRKPTVEDPDLLYRHCCSLEHVARLFEVSISKLSSLAIEKGSEEILRHPPHPFGNSEEESADVFSESSSHSARRRETTPDKRSTSS